jgi:hypothetical protein
MKEPDETKPTLFNLQRKNLPIFEANRGVGWGGVGEYVLTTLHFLHNS